MRTILGTSPSGHIADILSAGYGVFRYDDRGVGRVPGSSWTRTSPTSQDATARSSAGYTQSRASLGDEDLPTSGHSEVLYVAAQVACRGASWSRGDLAAYLTLSDRVLLDQMDALLELSGASEDQRRKLGRVNAFRSTPR